MEDFYNKIIKDYLLDKCNIFNKKIDLLVLDLNSLYTKRPSLYKYNNISLYYILNIKDKGIEDTVDMFIMTQLVKELINTNFDINHIVNNIESILYELHSIYNISSYLSDVIIDKLVIEQYLIEISSVLKNIISVYLSNNYSLLNITNSIKTIKDNFYILEDVNIYLDNDKCDMSIVLKVYSVI
ncbi:MAG: hypothetical protein AB7G52_02695 [Arcobacter sp.]